tara:strand:+ start:750 stop:1010 length:261 start_codon:yes stop_codon:yes gene_type:complete
MVQTALEEMEALVKCLAYLEIVFFTLAVVAGAYDLQAHTLLDLAALVAAVRAVLNMKQEAQALQTQAAVAVAVVEVVALVEQAALA